MARLRQQLFKNIWSSWASYAVRITISFFFVPYITAVLGDARYGVWVIVFQTINYFVLLDFGLEKALVRFVSKYLSERNFERINRTLNTSFGLYIVVGFAIMAGAALTSTLLFGYFKIGDPALVAEGQTALIIIGAYMGLRFFALPFAGSLGGFQRFDIANALNVIEEILRAAVLIWLLYNGYGLVALATAIVVMSALRQVVAFVLLKRLHPEVKFAPGLFDKSTARDLFHYSKITFGITLAWLVIFNTDTVLLGLLSSSALAGIYAPGAMLMLQLRNLINAVATPLTAAISHLDAKGDTETIRKTYLKGIRYASFLSFFVSAGVIMYARPFVALWLQPEFAEAAEVMRILAVSSAFFLPQIVGNAVLFGTDKHKYLLQVLVLEAGMKLILSLVLIKPYGLVGMAIAAAVPQLLLYITLYPVLMGRALNMSTIWILLTGLRSGLAAMFVCLPVTILIMRLLPPTDWPSLIVNVVIVTLPTAIAAYLVLEPDDKARVRARLGM